MRLMLGIGKQEGAVSDMSVWNVIHKAYTQNVQIRLTLYFLFILVPLVGVSLFAGYRSKDILEAQISERTSNNLESSLDYIDLMLEDLDKLSLLISSDHGIKPILIETNTIPLPTNLFGLYTVMERLTNIKDTHGSLHGISILHVASKILISSEYGGRRIAPEAYPWFASVMEASGKPVLYIEEDADEESLFGGNTVSFIRPMDLNEQDNEANVLILTVSQEELVGLINTVRPTSNSSVYLFSDEGELAAAASREAVVPDWTSFADEDSMRTDGMQMWRTPSLKSGWSLVMIQPEKELYKESGYVQAFIYVIIMLSVLLAFLISLIVYKGIAAPLATLLYGMKQLRLGKYETRLPSKRKDQFGVLTDAFNQMIEEQQRLIRDVYEQQLRLSHTELKFLQSQINPHFLYNTLDSIYWTAKNYDADEISEMVLNLSRFFRLSLSKGKENFTVAETVEHLQYYLLVQQYRLLGRLEVHYAISEDSKDVLVLKLLLQPIVENAILHGLEKRGRGGELWIASRVEDDQLCLSVTDNGPGIGKERLAFIRNEIERFERSDPSSPAGADQAQDLFGLRNVIGRMKLAYGSGAKLLIDSAEGEGTTVTLKIPIG